MNGAASMVMESDKATAEPMIRFPVMSQGHKAERLIFTAKSYDAWSLGHDVPGVYSYDRQYVEVTVSV